MKKRVLFFWGNHSLMPKERFPQPPSEKGEREKIVH